MSRRRPLLIEMIQSIVRWICRIAVMLAFPVRVYGLKNYPIDDGFLICANHQSHLDPVVLGVICPRPINILAKQSLFRFTLLGGFLKMNDAIPIDREASGIGGLKETLRRLKRKESVLIFPEGTRSPDGTLQPLKLGFCPLARRAGAALVPVAIAGSFAAWPRNTRFPRPHRTVAVIGTSITPAEYAELTDEELGMLLESRIQAALAEANRKLATKN
jgi:1-acyl-sn-glycerol-3-phosphate acyltransferase